MTTFFVKPDHEYGTYADYFQLAELSGYPIVSPGSVVDDASHCYIHTWFTSRFEDWTNCKARHIAWVLEWIQPDRDNEFPKGCDVWASDPWYAAKIGAKYVLFGSHPKLGDADDCRVYTQPYDMALMMYHSPRRQPVIHQFKVRDLRIAPNAWGWDREIALCNSRSMVHIHQHDGIPTIAPQRFALAAAYQLPIITEKLADESVFENVILTSDYAHLAGFAHQWLTGPQNGMLDSLGHALHQLLCVNRTFKREVEAAL